MQNASISALVPFYNEAGRIGPVLTCLRQSPHIGPIIAVDDGSTDAGLRQARAVARAITDAAILSIAHGGKSAAVWHGLAQVTTQFVLLVDADIGQFDVTQLDVGLAKISRADNIQMVLFFKCQPWLYNPLQTDFLTGQRILATDDLRAVFAQYNSSGFSLETDINNYMYQKKRRVVWMKTNIVHQTKTAKHGVVEGVKGSVAMLSDLRRVGTLTKLWQWNRAWLELTQ